jgi:hypothetical protein
MCVVAIKRGHAAASYKVADTVAEEACLPISVVVYTCRCAAPRLITVWLQQHRGATDGYARDSGVKREWLCMYVVLWSPIKGGTRQRVIK